MRSALRIFASTEFRVLLVSLSLLSVPGQCDDITGLPRSHPLTPVQAAATFAVQDGFSLQLVASEPLVTDPVAAAFDEDGRLFVVEMNDYPYTDKSTDRPNVERTSDLPLGKVRQLEDTDDDGVFDRSVIFARDLSWPTGIAVFRGGVFVTATPDVWYLKDEDGDGVAEIRERVFSGFRKLNVQAVTNNLIFGLDHRIYGAGGTNGGRIVQGRDESLSPVIMSRHDFCFDPDARTFELLSGGARFGNTVDDWGNRFICNIRNPIQHVVFPLAAMGRNRTLNVGSPLQDVAVSGDQIPVYRTSPPEPWREINAARLSSQDDPRMPRSEKNAVGFMTSASGVTVFRGDAYPPEFRQQVFLAEVAGNLVHRQLLEPQGVTFSSMRIDHESEFLTSTDNWFRPVNFVHAPDGTLLLLDMYRETIEHPWSMPDDLKAMLDLENGRDKGRIYRITPPGFKRRATPRMSQMTTETLVRQLEHPNAWNRDTAHRLLYERQDPAAVSSLEMLLGHSRFAPARLHALWTLRGMSRLSVANLLRSLDDSSPGVREHAAGIAFQVVTELTSAAERDDLLRSVLERSSDESIRVRFQFALGIGQLMSSELQPLSGAVLQGETLNRKTEDALRQIGLRDRSSPWVVSAVMSSSDTLASALLTDVLRDRVRNGGSGSDQEDLIFLRQLAVAAAARGVRAELDEILAAFVELCRDESPSLLSMSVLVALDEGLKRRNTPLRTFRTDSAFRDILEMHIRDSAAAVRDSTRQADERLLHLRIATMDADEDVTALLTGLITSQNPAEIQSASVRILASLPGEAPGRILVNSFGVSTPSVQHEIMESLAGNPARVRMLLDAIQQEAILPAQVTPIRRTLLMNHPDPDVREKAVMLLAQDRDTPRAEVIREYRDAVSGPADLERGRSIFVRECSLCHRIGDVGHEVGPSLITVRHRTPEELLVQILDPNREVGPGFMQFVVALSDGQILTGMISEETPAGITLLQQERRQQFVSRESIEEIRATGQSLMPEGFEKKLTQQDLADLIAYLRRG